MCHMSHSCCLAFAATHPLPNPTNPTQPLQIPQLTFACARKQQRVHLPPEKPAHVPGYHDPTLQVSSSHLAAPLCESVNG